MSISIFIFFIFLPFIFAIVFAFLLIHKNSFAVHTLLLTVLFSFLAVFVSSILQTFIFPLFNDFLIRIPIRSFLLVFDSFIYSGAIEEITKFLFFYCVLAFFVHPYIKKKECIFSSSTQKRQLLLLAMFFASCFAGFENIAYFVLNIDHWYMQSWLPHLWSIRLFTASLFHIFVSQYYLKTISKENSINFAFLAIPIFLHGLYNLFMAIGGVFFKISLTIIVFLLVRTYQNYQK